MPTNRDMVIEDLTLVRVQQTRMEDGLGVDGTRPYLRMASPLDRLAATILDLFLFILPVSTVLVAPLKRHMIQALILQNEADFYLFTGLLLLIVSLVIVIYQTMMIWLWGATIGKMFWRLRVKGLWKEGNPSIGSAFLRALFWLLDCLFLFLPHLAIFANEKRRPFHDRVADTVVVTIKQHGVSSPGLVEASFVRGVVAALAVFTVTSMSITSIESYIESKNDEFLLDSMEDEGTLCKAVGKASEDWLDGAHEGDELATRLKVAMALFASGDVAVTCLRAEVDLYFSRKGSGDPLSYLAQSFVYADNADLSDRYLDRVCEMDDQSDACKMSHVISFWAENRWEDIDQLFQDMRDTPERYILVWAVRHFVRRENYPMAQAFLDRLDPPRALGSFIGVNRVKTYWGLHRREEARAAAAVAFDTLSSFDRVELANWLCSEELNLGCTQARQASCRELNRSLNASKDLLTDRKTALTYIRHFACIKSKKDKFENLKRRIHFAEANQLLDALALHDHQQMPKSRQLLWQLAKGNEFSDDYREEARSYLAKWATNARELNPLYQEWQEEPLHTRWRQRGQNLFDQYFRLKNFKMAWVVGQIIVHDQSVRKRELDRETLEDVIVAGFRAGKKKQAYQLLINEKGISSPISLMRSPASEDGFSAVMKELREEFSQK